MSTDRWGFPCDHERIDRHPDGWYWCLDCSKAWTEAEFDEAFKVTPEEQAAYDEARERAIYWAGRP